MAISGGPDIIQDGLVLSLDAADRNSYPGSGTTWRDLSGNNRNTSLVNGPTYTASNSGGIVFDGVDDSLSIPYFNLTTQPLTVELWYRPGQNTSYLRGILSCGDIYSGPNQPGWCLGFDASGMVSVFGLVSNVNVGYKVNGATLVANNIYHLLITRDVVQEKLNYYVNGTLSNSVNVPASVSLSGNRTTVTHRIWAHGPVGPIGDFYSVKIYDNKSFSIAEVLQNYNAQKSRFNL